jgi:phosphoesterase RecJ-like protein
MQALYEEAKKLIDRAKNILIISHKKPDADTLGAAICMRIWLKDTGKEVVLACIDKPSSTFNFLPYLDEFVDEFDLKKFDLVIVMDAGANYMTGFHTKYENLFKSRVPVLNIDHHASNDKYGTINVVEPEAASTTVILYKMLNFWEVDITNKMATCLLSGVYGDTGGFMHSNTSGAVFEIAADLMNRGAHVSTVSKNLFGSKSISTLRLWGRVLENAYVTSDNIVMSVIKEDDYKEVKAKPEDLSGVVDYLNMVPEIKFAVLINDDRKGHIKGSFRTKNDDVDLSKVAAQYGGGGHPKASGFSIQGKLQEEVSYKIVMNDNVEKSLDFFGE